MKKMFQVSRFWISEVEKLYFFGLAFSIIFSGVMCFIDQETVYFEQMCGYFCIISIIYAMLNGISMFRGSVSTVISLNGRRRDIMTGSLVADIVFIVQCIITAALIEYINLYAAFQGYNIKLFVVVLLSEFLFMNTLGYIGGIISSKYGNAAFVGFAVVIYLIVMVAVVYMVIAGRWGEMGAAVDEFLKNSSGLILLITFLLNVASRFAVYSYISRFNLKG